MTHTKKLKEEVHHHPEGVKYMVNLLTNDRTLTVLQYDHIIRYLSDRKRVLEREEDKNRYRDDYDDQYDCCGGVMNESSSGSGSYESSEEIPLRERHTGMRQKKKKKKKKKKLLDVIDILREKTMLAQIEKKIKKNLEPVSEKGRNQLRDKLVDLDRLKKVTNELKGISNSWW